MVLVKKKGEKQQATSFSLIAFLWLVLTFGPTGHV